MVKSMTGYGRARETRSGRDITVEVRSVNNRYLDCTVKMPRLYAFAEDSVKTHVKSAISRGKVDVFIAVNVMEDMQMRISVNHPVLEGYLSAMRSIASDYGVRDDISVTALSRLPDVFVVEKAEEDEEKLTQDMETKILTIMSDPAMAAQSECDLLMQDVSISTSKKKSLYAERDFSVSAQVAEFLSLLLCFAMQREFVKREARQS